MILASRTFSMLILIWAITIPSNLAKRKQEYSHPSINSLQARLMQYFSAGTKFRKNGDQEHFKLPVMGEPRLFTGKAQDKSTENSVFDQDMMYEDSMSTLTGGPPSCITNDSQLAYVNGELSATQTFYNCLANVADPGMLPTYYNGSYHGQLVMNSTMVLNNLERVNEVEGTARLQFSLRLRWEDKRLAMPNFWNKVSSKTQSSGIDLTNIFFTNTSFVIWTPVIRFTDASDVEFQVEFLKFNASNVFMMGIGVDCTLLQPNFHFERYPWDKQSIVVRYNIFSMPANLAILSYWGGDGVIFNTNIDGLDTFKENPIWDFDSYYYTSYIGNSYYYWYYELNMSRRGEGIVLRLVLPITLLLCLGALTFWIVYDNRVDTTITLLLSVSALYIVILGNIPLLGYLTDVDKFVFAMFFLLVVIVAAHQWYVTLRHKEEHWPLRPVIMRLIELFGRSAMIPTITIYFLTHVYRQKITAPSTILITTTILIAFCGIFWRESYGFRKVFINSLIKLIEKVNDNKTTVNDTSLLEIFVLNIIVFRKFSLSRSFLTNHLSTHGAVDVESYMSISTKLQNLSLLSGNDNVNGNNKNRGPASTQLPGSRLPTFQAAQYRDSRNNSDYLFASSLSEENREQGQFRLSLPTSGIQLKDLSSTSRSKTNSTVLNPLANPAASDARRESTSHGTNIDSDDEES